MITLHLPQRESVWGLYEEYRGSADSLNPCRPQQLLAYFCIHISPYYNYDMRFHFTYRYVRYVSLISIYGYVGSTLLISFDIDS